jgi:3-hydroxyacyl-CoA dehydrogenase
MGNINAVVDLRQDGDIAVIQMQNAPVNALGFDLREGVLAALRKIKDDASIKAVVLTGTERAFSGGADITEFGKPPRPTSGNLFQDLENFGKPVVAAIHGLALGGGLELAMVCHYRVGWPNTRFGLPEVKLGLIPGAGGTQRLPRLIGPEKALKVIVTGDPIGTDEAKAEGLLDAVMSGPFPDAAVAWTRDLVAKGATLKKVRDRDERLQAVRANPKQLDDAAGALLRRARGTSAAKACLAAVKAAVDKPFDEGLALERKLFTDLVGGDESRAQRHIFFAEREALKVPDVPASVKPKQIKKAVMIGGGTMGGGIAMNFANVGIPVTIVETSDDFLKRGLGRVSQNYKIAEERGSMAKGETEKRMALIEGTTDFNRVAEADIIIEAVFEDMDLKKEIFARLDKIAKPGAILATNTSGLNVDEIASATKRPQDVVGMHFFSPANVMRLLEIVRGAKTSHETLVTAIDIGRKIGKVPAVVGICEGFVGNRILRRRGEQATKMLLEGALPHQVDDVMVEFGFPMGPFAMGDLAGLDIGYQARKAKGNVGKEERFFIVDALVGAGRLGQKSGSGYYRYDPGSRAPKHDPEVEKIIVEASKKAGITRREISKEEILDRLVLPMLNEGARILEEGIAIRASDIDVIWVYGYGWPVQRGGPMFYADLLGVADVRDRLEKLAAKVGDESLKPAPLIVQLAKEGRGFGSTGVRKAA